mgnify:CR=1 FL=1
MTYTLKLVDFITNTYETTFGTCDMCMHTGQATDETFVFELGSGRCIEADNTYWDWGDHFTAITVDNTADFAHWLSEQTFAGDEPDDITYSMLSELGEHYHDHIERERHKNDPVDLLMFCLELYLKDGAAPDADTMADTAELIDKKASELIPDVNIEQRYYIPSGNTPSLDVAKVSPSVLDHTDTTDMTITVDCRYLYSNNITTDPTTYVPRVRDFLQQCVDAYSKCGFSAQVGTTQDGSLVGCETNSYIEYNEYGVEKVAEIFVRPGGTEVCFDFGEDDIDADGAIQLTY